MNIDTKVYKKIQKYKNSLNKSKIIIRDNKANINNFNQITEIQDDDHEPYIKSKSLNKIKAKVRLNKSSIKLPNIKKNIFKNQNFEGFKKNSSTKKIKININSISQLYPIHNQNSKKLISKYASNYNLKIGKNMKSKNIHLNTQENTGKIRLLDRKKIKGNKKIIMPKNGYKLFTTTKIINNFNNQINQNKNKEIFSLSNNDNENTGGKKLDVLYEIEQKISKIQNCFRNHLKKEERETKNDHILNNNIDIISDISLSEEELNFSEEDSFNGIDFSLDEEEI
jgi:hypothetical protein